MPYLANYLACEACFYLAVNENLHPLFYLAVRAK
jgi:hypothetical protein